MRLVEDGLKSDSAILGSSRVTYHGWSVCDLARDSPQKITSMLILYT